MKAQKTKNFTETLKHAAEATRGVGAVWDGLGCNLGPCAPWSFIVWVCNAVKRE